MTNSTPTDSDRIACEISIQKRVAGEPREYGGEALRNRHFIAIAVNNIIHKVITRCINIAGSPRLFAITVITHELNGDRTNSENNRLMSGFCEYETIALKRMSL